MLWVKCKVDLFILGRAGVPGGGAVSSVGGPGRRTKGAGLGGAAGVAPALATPAARRLERGAPRQEGRCSPQCPQRSSGRRGQVPLSANPSSSPRQRAPLTAALQRSSTLSQKTAHNISTIRAAAKTFFFFSSANLTRSASTSAPPSSVHSPVMASLCTAAVRPTALAPLPGGQREQRSARQTGWMGWQSSQMALAGRWPWEVVGRWAMCQAAGTSRHSWKGKGGRES